MINFDNFEYETDCSPRQCAVLAKYNKQELEEAITQACFAFFSTIHNRFIGEDKPDNSDGDLPVSLADLALEYIWDNDLELQKEYEY